MDLVKEMFERTWRLAGRAGRETFFVVVVVFWPKVE